MQIYATGNCNFNYADGLSAYTNRNMKEALLELLTQPKPYTGYGSPVPVTPYKSLFRPITSGMMLFAQGSEHSAKTNPYARTFKSLLEELKLGTVIELPPVPNPLHRDKPGILFVWVVDHKATLNWWTEQTTPVVEPVVMTPEGKPAEPVKPKRVPGIKYVNKAIPLDELPVIAKIVRVMQDAQDKAVGKAFNEAYKDVW